jgi:hypothetical protein
MKGIMHIEDYFAVLFICLQNSHGLEEKLVEMICLELKRDFMKK